MFKLIPDYVWGLLGACGAILLVLGVFKAGYTFSENKYQKIIAEQQVKIKDLESREAVVEKEIVIEYRDRVQTITKVKEKIVEVTKNVLSEETNHCDIGPGFISLHNAAASNKAIPGSTKGTDATSTGPKESTGKD